MKTYIYNNLDKVLISAAILTVVLWTVAAISIYPINKQIRIEKEKLAMMKK